MGVNLTSEFLLLVPLFFFFFFMSDNIFCLRVGQINKQNDESELGLLHFALDMVSSIYKMMNLNLASDNIFCLRVGQINIQINDESKLG